MYELSRDLFRALRPGLAPDRRDPARPARIVLALCEEAVQRVAQFPAGRRVHARRLFVRARAFYAPSDQLALVTRIETAIAEVHQRLVEQMGGQQGGLLRCAAMTRRQTRCMREPLLGMRYCPSHRRLESADVAPAMSHAMQ